jgi:hypothetical protein
LYPSTACQFSALTPRLFCTVEKEKGETDLISMSAESGAVEEIATFSGSRYLLASPHDDQTFFFSGNAWLLGVNEPPVVRWDQTTKLETIVEPSSEDRRLLSVSQTVAGSREPSTERCRFALSMAAIGSS